MSKTSFCLLAAAILAGTSLGSLAAPAAITPAAAPVAAAPKPREFGGKMPLPVDQRLERQNSPEDKLLVEVTHSAPAGTAYVAYVKIVWGDLDNLIKADGAQHYSNWDGSLKITAATGAIDEKIQFDDGTAKAVAGKLPKPPVLPHAGSGRDEVITASGPAIEWKSGVVGALDGLRIKITSPTPLIHATLIAGKFTLPLTITGAAAPAPISVIAPPAKPAPAGPSGTVSNSTLYLVNPTKP